MHWSSIPDVAATEIHLLHHSSPKARTLQCPGKGSERSEETQKSLFLPTAPIRPPPLIALLHPASRRVLCAVHHLRPTLREDLSQTVENPFPSRSRLADGPRFALLSMILPGIMETFSKGLRGHYVVGSIISQFLRFKTSIWT